MPVYTYRREDGTTFDIQQKFLDDPLTVDPSTGQKVVRVVQAAGIIFKGSGFYVNDSKSGSRNSATAPVKGKDGDTAATSESNSGKTDAASSESKNTSAPAGDAPSSKSDTPAPKTETKAAAAD